MRTLFVPLKIASIVLLFLIGANPSATGQLPGNLNFFAVQTGYFAPLGTAFADSGRTLFVWDKAGRIFASRWNGTTYIRQANPVLDLSEEVGNWRDFGLLSICPDPNFDQNGLMYLYYVVDRHHLLFFGTPQYNPATNSYYNATISRITRYRLSNTEGVYNADPASRFILLGETKNTGVPLLHESHMGGTLVFGSDGTLMLSTGDAASYGATDVGSLSSTYFAQAIADSILRPGENVGAFRSQMINSFNGKVLRIDPVTGDGIPSNPFYDAANPRSPQSRVWAMGFRNPCRMAIQPNSGSTNPADGNPGNLFVADVGWGTWEEVSILNTGGLNCGWPLYEGQTALGSYFNSGTVNPDEGGLFRDRCVQPGSFNIDPVPANRRLVHCRPAIAWKHGTNDARVPWFNGTTPTDPIIGSASSPTAGIPFAGNCASGICFFTSPALGARYQNTLFFGDYGTNFIKNTRVNSAQPWFNSIDTFAPANFAKGLIDIKQNPLDGSLFYVNINTGQIMRIGNTNQPPVVNISATPTSGLSPLTVNFSSAGTLDPEGNTLSYLWNFGDGTTSTEANPVKVYTVSGIQNFTATLTVTDSLQMTASKSLVISLNNTAPTVAITNPVNNSKYSILSETQLTLAANVTDGETTDGMRYAWQIALRHNNHEHREPVIDTPNPTVTISPVGCDGETYYYHIELTVTDNGGLTATDSVDIYPDCNTPGLAVSNLTATPLSGAVRLDWTNPASYFDEVMVAARPASGFLSNPGGTNYTADSSYLGNGTAFEQGKIVYRGSGQRTTTLNLTPGLRYFFRVFTRIGSSWTGGVETSAMPITTLNTLDNVGLNGTARMAYGIRKMSSAYVGNAINVRRSSDNATTDIGFTPTGDLDQTALLTFVGTGNGFVTRWYDQSGNAFHASQGTAANQPMIVNSGVLVTNNTRPAISFSGANNNNLLAQVSPSVYPISLNLVANTQGLATKGAFVKFGGNNDGIGIGVGNPGGSFDTLGNSLIVRKEASAWCASNPAVSYPSIPFISTTIQPAGSGPLVTFLNGNAVPLNNASATPVAITASDDITELPGVLTAQGENGTVESASKAIDNQTGTKWLDFASANPNTRASWLQWQLTGRTAVVTAYTITSANDAPDRDPKNWTLLGSNDGGATWTTLDTRTNETFASRFLKKSYVINNLMPYSTYRLNITSVNNPAAANSVQLAEFELLTSTGLYIGGYAANNPRFAQVRESELIVLGTELGMAERNSLEGNQSNYFGMAVPVTGVELSPTTALLPVGGTQQLTATLLPADATIKNVIWSSSDTSVATVNATGLVTALALGTATITVTTVDGSKTATATLTVFASTLTGTVVSSSAAVNLTTEGSGDWAHWPGYDRKATGGGKISNFTPIGRGRIRNYSNDPRNCVWSDGTPTNSGSNRRGVFVSGIGSGFQLSAPADQNQRTIRLYVGGWRSGGTLTASLSDRSASDYVHVISPTMNATGQYNAVYTLTYRATSASARINIRWVHSSGASGNVNLQGATLVESLPVVNVTGVSVNPSVVSLNVGSTQQLTATITPSNATHQNVIWNSLNPSVATVSASGLLTMTGAGTAQVTAITVDGNRSASVSVTGTAIPATSISVSPTTGQLLPGASLSLLSTLLPANATNQNVIWSSSNPAVATVSVGGLVAAVAIGTTTITVTNVDGNLTASSLITVSNTATGLLSGTAVSSIPSVNLTSEGGVDWIRWPGNDRKSTGGNKISSYTLIGTGNMATKSNDMRLCNWSDGAPTASGSERSSVIVSGIGRGFRFRVPADPTMRVLKVYVGGWQSGGTLTATLSDGSAPEYVHVSSPTLSPTGQFSAVYTLVYKSASTGQALHVQWVQTSGASGNVSLQAATLSEASSPGTVVKGNEPLSRPKVDALGSLQVYPNPVRDLMQLGYDGPETGGMTVNIFDAVMNRVAQYPVEKLTKGAWSGSFSMVGLTKGVYIVQLRIGNQTINRRILRM